MGRQIRLSESEMRSFVGECARLIVESIPQNLSLGAIQNKTTKKFDRGQIGFPERDTGDNDIFYSRNGNDPLNYDAIAKWMMLHGMPVSYLYAISKPGNDERFPRYWFSQGIHDIVDAYGIDEIVYGVDRAIKRINIRHDRMQDVERRRREEFQDRYSEDPNVRFDDLRNPNVAQYLSDDGMDYTEDYPDDRTNYQKYQSLLNYIGKNPDFGKDATPEERVGNFFSHMPGSNGSSEDRMRKLDMLRGDIADFLKQQRVNMQVNYLDDSGDDYEERRAEAMRKGVNKIGDDGKRRYLKLNPDNPEDVEKFERMENDKADVGTASGKYNIGAKAIMDKYGLSEKEFGELVDIIGRDPKMY